ncbi:MAG TPA: hypothetical protein VGJ53_17255 [Micromonosporaceae bacterium]
MPGDPTALLAPVVRPLLRSGEQLRIAARVRTDPGVTERVPLGRELVGMVNPLAWFGLDANPGHLVRRLTWGYAVVGPEHCLARDVYAVVDEQMTRSALAVTGERLIVVGLRPTGRTQMTPDGVHVSESGVIVGEWPRAVIRRAVRTPRGILRRGRFELSFGDDSSCALLCEWPPQSGPLVEELAAVGRMR